MDDPLFPFYATIATSPSSTADILIYARSFWAAQWLAHRLYPDTLRLVRPARDG